MQFAYLANLSPRVRMIVSAGPSVFSVEQTFVTDVKFSQEYPYDTATFTGATTQRSHASNVGFNAGADSSGCSAASSAPAASSDSRERSVTEDAGNGRSLSLDAGGVQVAAGVRFLF